MRGRDFVLVTFCVSFLVFVPRRTNAQAHPSSCAGTDANVLTDEGHKHFEKEDYERAFVCYQKADNIAHTGKRRLFMARARKKGKRYDDARLLLDDVLTDPAATAEDKKRAQKDLNEVAALSPASPPKVGPPLSAPKVDPALPPKVDPPPAPPKVDPPPAPPNAEPPWQPPRGVFEPPVKDDEQPSEIGDSGQRVAAYVTGGIGVAGVVVGAIAGGLTLASKDNIKRNCQLDDSRGVALCNHVGVEDGESAKRLGLASTVGLIAGAGMLGLGIVLFVAEPDRPSKGGPQSGKGMTVARARRMGGGDLTIGMSGFAFGVRGRW